MKSPVEDERAFCQAAKKYNILIVPGSSFACPGYVRLAYCVSYETIVNSLPKFACLLYTSMSRAVYFADADRKMAEEKEAQYAALIKKRSKRIPLQHLTGVQEFMGLEFQVNEHVLIPRQDTEVLVETALDFLKQRGGKNMEILDLCTGSGCILLSLLFHAQQELSLIHI